MAKLCAVYGFAVYMTVLAWFTPWAAYCKLSGSEFLFACLLILMPSAYLLGTVIGWYVRWRRRWSKISGLSFRRHYRLLWEESNMVARYGEEDVRTTYRMMKHFDAQGPRERVTLKKDGNDVLN